MIKTPKINGTRLKKESIDEDRRQFLCQTTCLLGLVGAGFALTPFVASWLPSASVREAGGPIHVDLTPLQPGQLMTVAWRGKPVWILRRTLSMLQQLTHVNEQLRDPESRVDQQPAYARNAWRSRQPEYLVLIGICTHLGCTPKYKPQLQTLGQDEPGGFICPCHGSNFDLAGRVFKNMPAPINLEVPPHHFVNAHTLVIGE